MFQLMLTINELVFHIYHSKLLYSSSWNYVISIKVFADLSFLHLIISDHYGRCTCQLCFSLMKITKYSCKYISILSPTPGRQAALGVSRLCPCLKDGAFWPCLCNENGTFTHQNFIYGCIGLNLAALPEAIKCTNHCTTVLYMLFYRFSNASLLTNNLSLRN